MSVDGETRRAGLLGRPYAVSGHVLHGRKLGRDLGFRTLNLRFGHPKPAAMGIFVVQVMGLADGPLPVSNSTSSLPVQLVGTNRGPSGDLAIGRHRSAAGS